METTITNDTLSTTSETEVATEEAVVESAAPQAETDTTETEAEGTAAAEEDATQDESNESLGDEPAEALWSLGISYNHEDVELTKDEAVRLSQLGKHYEENIKATFDNLDYLAALRGKTPKEYIDELISVTDSMYREQLIRELGEDNEHIEDLIELRRAKNDKAYQKVKQEREEKENKAFEEKNANINTRLAEQFESIKKVFPNYESISDIPSNVFKAAVKSGDLEKEVLRFHFAEQKKIEEANKKENINKSQSIGTAKANDTEDGVSSAFKRGLWG